MNERKDTKGYKETQQTTKRLLKESISSFGVLPISQNIITISNSEIVYEYIRFSEISAWPARL